MRQVALIFATWLGSVILAVLVWAVGAGLSGKSAQEGERALMGMWIAFLILAGVAITLAILITKGASLGRRLVMVLALVVGEVVLVGLCGFGALVLLNR